MSGPVLVVLSVFGMQGGQAIAKMAFVSAGPVQLAAMRFGFGALVLLAIWRPAVPTDRYTQLAVLAMGTALAGTNVFVFESIARLPLGLAVTIQFMGALAISIGAARRRNHIVWALLAGLGVILISGDRAGTVSVAGVAFAVASAICWGAYILLNSHVGARTSGGGCLALATCWAAVLTVPPGVLMDPGTFAEPSVLTAGLAAALLCTVLGNSLELRAMRKIPARVFSVLVSLEPTIAALAGFVLLGEHLTLTQWIAVVSIVIASIGVVSDRSVAKPGDNHHPGQPDLIGIERR